METSWISGKTCLITGATSGIGLATARMAVQAGASVVLVGRDPSRGRVALANIRQCAPGGKAEFLQADLSLLAEVRRLASEFSRQHDRLEVLINNVGVFFLRPRLTAEGWETTLAVNYLGVYLLTRLLLGALEHGGASRIIHVSSDSHRSARLDVDYLSGWRKYAGNKAYAQTKLAMVMFSHELARRLQTRGITSNAMHPGFTATRMFENSGGIVKFLAPVIKRMGHPPDMGADTVFYLASAEEVEGVTGKYFVRRQTVDSSPESYDKAAAGRLYQLTQDVVGIPGI